MTLLQFQVTAKLLKSNLTIREGNNGGQAELDLIKRLGNIYSVFALLLPQTPLALEKGPHHVDKISSAKSSSSVETSVYVE
jgi:hypothetical protein